MRLNSESRQALARWLPDQLEDDWDPISQAHRAVLTRHGLVVVSLVGYGEYEAEAHVCAACTPGAEPDVALDFDRVTRWPCGTWQDIALAYQHNDGYRPDEWRP